MWGKRRLLPPLPFRGLKWKIQLLQENMKLILKVQNVSTEKEGVNHML